MCPNALLESLIKNETAARFSSLIVQCKSKMEKMVKAAMKVIRKKT